MKPILLIVDDEESVRESFRLALQNDYRLAFAEDVKTTLHALKNQAFDLCLLDILLPDGSGLDLLRQIKRRDENIEVIMVTALQGVDTALTAMKGEACDYITKPFQIADLRELIQRVLVKRSQKKNTGFSNEERYDFQAAILTETNETLREAVKRVEKASQAETPVWLTGEIGTGVEEAAHEIHLKGSRASGPFVALDCFSGSKNNLYKELFGEDGKNKTPQIGKLEFAHRGTLFLKQADHLSLEAQDKLIRFLGGKKMNRQGGPSDAEFDVRVIISSEGSPLPRVEEGLIRRDFYQYFNVISILFPPLRERPKDIPLLIHHFLKAANLKAKVAVKNIQKEALEFLAQYPWPGNLLELENCVETMVLFAGKDTLGMEDIPLDILIKQGELTPMKAEARLSLKKVTRQFERKYIRKVLEHTRGNQTRAAKALGLNRNTLIWKLKKLKLEEEYKKIVKNRRELGIGFRGLNSR